MGWAGGQPQPTAPGFECAAYLQSLSCAYRLARLAQDPNRGERLTLRSLSAEPGYGFLTLTVHSDDHEGDQLIVPVGAIRRITLGPADEDRRPGFALPSGSK